jgi:hypothetical protein
VDRWKAASAQFWRTEPGARLGLLLLLDIAETAILHLLGWVFHHSHGYTVGPLFVGLASNAGSALMITGWLIWRIWLGGHISWLFSLLFSLGGVTVSASGCWRAASPFMAGCLLSYVSFTVLLLTPAVLNRVDHRTGRRQQHVPARRYGAV